MADLDLLGVGSGVIQSKWAGQQQQRHVRDQSKSQMREATPITETDTRDSRMLKEAAAEFNKKVIGYSQTVDLASIAANTTENRLITVISPDKVRAGDYVLFAGASSLEYGVHIVGFPAPANDTIQIRLTNITASPIDPASQTFYFILFRDIIST